MSSTIHIRCKATGEHFDVPFQLETTIEQLIAYVCQNSILLSNQNSNDYYMSINDCDVLKNDKTIQDLNLDQPNQYRSLNVCIKTKVLIERISRNHTSLWQDLNKKSNKIKRTPSPENHLSLINNPTTVNSNESDDEIHILICGGPNVGKSTLINAFCGCPVAKTNTFGLDQCTKKTSSYQLDNIFFWDTPGIQQWSHIDINSYLSQFRKQQTPLCMFYCASPGSFTKLKQLNILLDQCINQRHIFCVLVVTNMYMSKARDTILQEFQTLLRHYVSKKNEIKEIDGIYYYGRIGLCTMINSIEFIDEDNNRQYPQKGINELVLALTKIFHGTCQLDSWLQTIERNQQFWLQNQEELFQLTKKPPETCLSELI